MNLESLSNWKNLLLIMEPSSKRKSLPKGMQKKLNSVLQEISTSSDKIKSKMTHVEPVVQTKMPEKLENELCITYKQFPVTYNYKCPRFEVSDPAGYKHLEDYGYVVFKNVIPNSSEIDNIKTEIWDWLEKLPFPNDVKIDRNKPSTWYDGNWPTDPDTGIVFSFGIGQTEFMWKCRSFPGINSLLSTFNHQNIDIIITVQVLEKHLAQYGVLMILLHHLMVVIYIAHGNIILDGEQRVNGGISTKILVEKSPKENNPSKDFLLSPTVCHIFLNFLI